MSERKWTPDQKNAIYAQDGTLLVSAAAGSGKTAVLVERVINRITKEKDPCDIDSLLIVTFTKAAAEEMRERIDAALTRMRRQNPFDSKLLRQQMLLSQASICTIDSFCNDLVKSNFEKLGISPDYRILDNAELAVVRDTAVQNALEQMYARKDPAFISLVELMSGGRDDSALVSAIFSLSTYITAHPFPEKWLERMTLMYKPTNRIEETLWGKAMLSYAASAIEFSAESLNAAKKMLLQDGKLYEAYSPSIEDGINQLEALTLDAENGEWDDLVQGLDSFAFLKFKAVRGFKDDPLKLAVTARRDEVKKRLGHLKEIFCITRAEHFEDMQALYPQIKALCDCVLLYSEQFQTLKEKRRALDFSDLEHLALKLLVKPTDDGFERTPEAIEISQRYTEILVDEYQDTNETQDMLFRAVSKNEKNLFFVGDVKQSIYRFRQAMPEIFLRRMNGLQMYEEGKYPARINLDRNFRSRYGVTQAVNYFFSQLMSENMGGLLYGKEESLVCGAKYFQHDEPDYELHILNDEEREMYEEKDAFEAKHIAGVIQSMIDSGHLIQDGDETRKAQYGDFCVLLRSANVHAQNYVDVFKSLDIPACADLPGGFFAAQEISVMLAFLRILDNPLQDVAFLTVMLSPIYGFTADDAAKLRLKQKGPLYFAACKYAEEGDERYTAFLAELSNLRRAANALPCDMLLRKIHSDTGYSCMVLAMPDSRQRQSNLNLLLEYAQTYESSGYKGLSSFIRFVDTLQRQEQDFSAAGASADGGNVVRVMSIHRSKGLEFPICILAGCAGKFNAGSRIGNILLHPEYGIGIKRQDKETLRKFNTVAYEAVKLETERAELSEELRVLYVAMTRAREKLITVMTVPNPEKRLAALASGITADERLQPFIVRKASGYADWILTCALRHPDAYVLRSLAGIDDDIMLKTDFSMKIVLEPCRVKEKTPAALTRGQTPEEELTKELENRFSYTYAWTPLQTVLAKYAASEIGALEKPFEFFGKTRPAFMNESGLSPAQEGSALHKFMQYADYKNARKDVRAEIKRLTTGGWLSENESGIIPIDKITAFFSSEIAKRIFSSEHVYREQKFTVYVPAKVCQPNLTSAFDEEKILVQGIADCAFEEDGQLVIVDYKTDKVSSAKDLADRYSSQLSIYREALEKCTGLKVKECLLYSFGLGMSVKVI